MGEMGGGGRKNKYLALSEVRLTKAPSAPSVMATIATPSLWMTLAISLSS